MAFFGRDDSHFLVFFAFDKSTKLLIKQRVEFRTEDDVKVSYETLNITEDGNEILEDVFYDGKIIFSGGKCLLYYNLYSIIQFSILTLYTDSNSFSYMVGNHNVF